MLAAMNSHKDGPTLLSINAFSDDLGIGRTTTYKLIKAGSIKVIKIGRRTLIASSERDSYVASLTNVDKE